jgi:hypothetical protein
MRGPGVGHRLSRRPGEVTGDELDGLAVRARVCGDEVGQLARCDQLAVDDRTVR